MDEEITQIKKTETAGYLDTKDPDKINSIICFNLRKMRQKDNEQNKK